MAKPVRLESTTAASKAAIPSDAWRRPRAAAFLGIAVRTLDRLVDQGRVPCIVYPAVRVKKDGRKDARPMIAFDPDDLARYRASYKVGGFVADAADA